MPTYEYFLFLCVSMCNAVQNGPCRDFLNHDLSNYSLPSNYEINVIKFYEIHYIKCYLFYIIIGEI